MITRPLELASRLRPEPRNFDFLFWINAGLIVLFFSLFGSRFVLAPGLGIDFQLPRVPAAYADEAQSTDYITVKRGGLLLVSDRGQISLAQLRGWLAEQMEAKKKARETKRPILLVRTDASVEMSVLAEIMSTAREAGFWVEWAVEPVAVPPGESH
jgi:biopolymer transport protein ExbD